jgi:CyaY protein
MMSETEFLDLAESTLTTIESAMDRLNDEDVIDVECKRSGNVLEIEFIDNGSKIIVNSQAPMQELWVAAKSGGFHYKRVGADWIRAVAAGQRPGQRANHVVRNVARSAG